MKIIALPRDSNPYQRLLYEQFERAGHVVRYAGQLTPSNTLNVILLPVELAVCRLRGWRILHVHWVWAFKLSWSDRFPFMRRLAQAWFGFVLGVSRALGFRVLWTAHNVLPHERVFHDEIAARWRLVRSSELVLAHSRAALDELERIGLKPKRSAVVPHGPLDPRPDASALRPPGAGSSMLQLLFFGHILEYKGVEDLLEAIKLVPQEIPVRLLVAGQCNDSALRERLRRVAALDARRIRLRLERIPDDEVTTMLAASDAVVLPYRRATTSGSAILAMGHGRVVILPDLPAFGDLPRDAAVFYDGSTDGLCHVIIDIARSSPGRLQELGAAASAYVGGLSWADTARQMLAAIGAQP